MQRVAGFCRVSDRTILVEGIEPGLSDAVLLPCSVLSTDRSTKASLL
jgi:hypothetical protein